MHLGVTGKALNKCQWLPNTVQVRWLRRWLRGNWGRVWTKLEAVRGVSWQQQ